jgi:hypothetical protein
MALSGLLQEASLGLAESFSSPGYCFPFGSGYFFLLHEIAPVVVYSICR